MRERANSMYEKQELQNYYIPQVDDDLLQIMLDANNKREFKYV